MMSLPQDMISNDFDSAGADNTFNICNILLSLNQSDAQLSSEVYQNAVLPVSSNSITKSKIRSSSSKQIKETLGKRPHCAFLGEEQAEPIDKEKKYLERKEADARRKARTIGDDQHEVQRLIGEQERKYQEKKQIAERRAKSIEMLTSKGIMARPYRGELPDQKVKYEKMTDQRKRGRFMWPDFLHKMFIGAIYDIGLSHSNMDILVDMMQRNAVENGRGPLHAAVVHQHMSDMQEFRLISHPEREVMQVSSARLEKLQEIESRSGGFHPNKRDRTLKTFQGLAKGFDGNRPMMTRSLVDDSQGLMFNALYNSKFGTHQQPAAPSNSAHITMGVRANSLIHQIMHNVQHNDFVNSNMEKLEAI